MIWFVFALGVALGAFGYWLYDKYAAKVEQAALAEERAAHDKVKAELAALKAEFAKLNPLKKGKKL